MMRMPIVLMLMVCAACGGDAPVTAVTTPSTPTTPTTPTVPVANVEPIAVLTPTLVTSWLWMNGGVLFWMMTVPGVACALAGSVAFVVLIRRGLFQVRLRDIGAREEKA